jgi:hypothetical protein
MTGRRRRWLRILGTWPLAYVVVVVTAAQMLDLGARPLPFPELLLPSLFVVHFATILLALGVLLICLIYLWTGAPIALWEKAVWSVGLLLATILATPLFIWWRVRPNES